SSSHSAEANHQVGTHLYSRHSAPAPTLPASPKPPQNHPASPRVTATRRRLAHRPACPSLLCSLLLCCSADSLLTLLSPSSLHRSTVHPVSPPTPLLCRALTSPE